MRLLIASDAHGDANATRLLRESYALERPDYVVHLGDMVDGQTANASTSLRELLAAAPGPRWLILGNHDEEALPASEILRIAGQPRASRVLQNDDATLYFLDRRDWWSVVESPVNATGPALAFIHEPLPQYALPRRELVEPVSPADSGSLWPMLRQRGVVATFAGHDHLNSDCGRWSGVWLCYAGSLGGYGRDDAPGACNATTLPGGCARRVRIVDVTPTSIKTWARLAGGARTQERVLWRA